MDGRTDGAILICHPKFFRGHKKLKFRLLQFLFGALRVKFFHIHVDGLIELSFNNISTIFWSYQDSVA